MIDNTFAHAIYYFLMNHHVVLYTITYLVSVVFIISFLTILKEWGSYK